MTVGEIRQKFNTVGDLEAPLILGKIKKKSPRKKNSRQVSKTKQQPSLMPKVWIRHCDTSGPVWLAAILFATKVSNKTVNWSKT